MTRLEEEALYGAARYYRRWGGDKAVRLVLAKEAMNGILSGCGGNFQVDAKEVARKAVECADELLRRISDEG